MTAHLVTIGQHIPKLFPKSPNELLGKKTAPVPFTKEQWAAAIASVITDTSAGPGASRATN